MPDETTGTSPEPAANDMAAVDAPADDVPADDVPADDMTQAARLEAEQALHEARERLAGIPAEIVVVNHAMGLYELAAIHLSADDPDLDGARLAIDAMTALVEGLGDRLGSEAATLREAMTAIRMAYVAVARTHSSTDRA